MTRLILLLGICAALAGCATSGTSHVPAGMRVATSDMVSGCKLLGDIHGVSSLYGVFAESALSKARQQAFEQARSMGANTVRSEEHTSELQSLMRISYAVFCLQKKKTPQITSDRYNHR